MYGRPTCLNVSFPKVFLAPLSKIAEDQPGVEIEKCEKWKTILTNITLIGFRGEGVAFNFYQVGVYGPDFRRVG